LTITLFLHFEDFFMKTIHRATTRTNADALRRIILAFALAPVLAFFIASCSTTTTTPTPSKTDLLTAKDWKLQAIPAALEASLGQVVTTVGIPGLDANAIRAILLSIKFKFTADGKVTATATILGQSLTENGTWKFQSNEAQLVITFPQTGLTSAFTGTYDIVSLASDKLGIRQTDVTKLEFTFIPAN
jgi:hypothetical protein